MIQSLLQAEGVDRAFYRTRFGADPLDDFASTLARFADAGWLTADANWVRLTSEGLALSDAIGPALISPSVSALMDSYEAR